MNGTGSREQKFEPGQLEYTTTSWTLEALENYFSGEGKGGDWSGYLAYSGQEVVVSGGNAEQMVPLLKEVPREGETGKQKGYLMEIALWRESPKGTFEEVSIEREDGGYFFQRWKLMTYPTGSDSDGSVCYYREADATKGSPGSVLFRGRNMKAIEVVVPEKRLNFFITREACAR